MECLTVIVAPQAKLCGCSGPAIVNDSRTRFEVGSCAVPNCSRGGDSEVSRRFQTWSFGSVDSSRVCSSYHAEKFACHFRCIAESDGQDSMNGIEQNRAADALNLTLELVPSVVASPQPPKLGALASLRVHWPEYLMEAALLGAFMVSACVFGALYEFPRFARSSSDHVRHFCGGLLMGMSMGLTAIAHHLLALGKTVGSAHQPFRDIHFLPPGQDEGLGRSFLYRGAIHRVRCWAWFWWHVFWGRKSRIRRFGTSLLLPGPHGPWVALAGRIHHRGRD